MDQKWKASRMNVCYSHHFNYPTRYMLDIGLVQFQNGCLMDVLPNNSGEISSTNKPILLITVLRKSFCKTSFQVGMDLKEKYRNKEEMKEHKSHE